MGHVHHSAFTLMKQTSNYRIFPDSKFPLYKIRGDLGKDAFCQMSHQSLFLDEHSFFAGSFSNHLNPSIHGCVTASLGNRLFLAPHRIGSTVGLL